MRKRLCNFEEIAANVAAVESLRDKVRREAFDQLEAHASSLATMAMQAFGNRELAASWMYTRRRKLDGKSAYEALAEGDLDKVWDLMIGSEDVSLQSHDPRIARLV
jgi:hypothetical protein